MKSIVAMFLIFVISLLNSADIEILGYPPVPNPTDLGKRAALLLYMESELGLTGLDNLSKDELIDIYKVTIDAKRKSSQKPMAGTGGLIIEVVKNSDSPFGGLLNSNKVELLDRNGKPVSLSKFKSKKFIFLYFTAGWCPYCLKYTPKLLDYYNKHADVENFEVIQVSWDKTEDELRQYQTAYNIPRPTIRWGSGIIMDLNTRHNVTGIPALEIINESGNVVFSSSINGKYVGPDSAVNSFFEYIIK